MASKHKFTPYPQAIYSMPQLTDGDTITDPQGNRRRVFTAGTLVYDKRYRQHGTVEPAGTVEAFGPYVVIGRVEPVKAKGTDRPNSPAENADMAELAEIADRTALCGAPTKSGGACQRKATTCRIADHVTHREALARGLERLQRLDTRTDLQADAQNGPGTVQDMLAARVAPEPVAPATDLAAVLTAALQAAGLAPQEEFPNRQELRAMIRRTITELQGASSALQTLVASL